MRITVAERVDDATALDLWPVYDAVFGDQPSLDEWRSSVWDRHVARDGFRLARALDGERLVGFAYGYTGERGQWWSDRVVDVLPASVSREWVGGHFELVSIGVLPSARAGGVGARLLEALTTGLPHERRLLMTTADPDDPARRLYARTGWSVLGPGLGDDRVVMGRLRGDDAGQFFHGTKADVRPGDLLSPGYSSNYGGRATANFIYLTATLDAATWGAELAVGDGPGRIYRVEPTGIIEDDPNLTDQRFPDNPTRSYRTRAPLRVLGEVEDWEPHPPEVLQHMRDRLVELERLGIEAIND